MYDRESNHVYSLNLKVFSDRTVGIHGVAQK